MLNQYKIENPAEVNLKGPNLEMRNEIAHQDDCKFWWIVYYVFKHEQNTTTTAGTRDILCDKNVHKEQRN